MSKFEKFQKQKEILAERYSKARASGDQKSAMQALANIYAFNKIYVREFGSFGA